jgi:hypothetical protein
MKGEVGVGVADIDAKKGAVARVGVMTNSQ